MYRISEDSPVTHAVVDGLHLAQGDDFVDLTPEQAARLMDSDVKLETDNEKE